jgi:ribulose 1,5-bisphosphate synthetase/thiazole synthase
MTKTITEAAREIPVIAEVDVLVAGGGPAGIAAAIAAGREGARTLLVERYGYLGGMITGAHVVAILGMGNGYHSKARGILTEIRDRLNKLGAVTMLGDQSKRNEDELAGSGDYRVDAEVFKWQAVEMVQEAGADLLMQTQVCAPIMQGGRVAGIYVESKSGRQAILAQVTIDATADADLAYRAGVPCDNETHDVSLVLHLEGVDKARVDAFAAASPHEYEAINQEARRLFGGVPLTGSRYLKGVDIADAVALTRAEMQLRREAFQTLYYLRAHLPGYEQARISVTQPQFGVRLGRRIHGAYRLVDDDLITNRHFEDGIGRLGVYFPDWGPIYARKGLDYDVPYRTLVPQGVDGLLVAGRCISSDYRTGNTMRLIVPCFATGQAAGAAAGIAVELECAPRAVPSATLRAALAKQDVFLG